MSLLSKSVTPYYLRIPTCASLIPNAFCVIFAIDGFMCIPRIMLRPSVNGKAIGRLARNCRILRITSYLYSVLIHLILEMLNLPLLINLFSPPITVLPLSEQQLALASHPTISRATPSRLVLPPLSTVRPTNDATQKTPSPSFKEDLNSGKFSTSPDSRRRNAEQRAATLRSDLLLGAVEPNRVFCTLCRKWVQLRQDSAYCAYPWLQHRGKCLKRQLVQNFCIRMTYSFSRTL